MKTPVTLRRCVEPEPVTLWPSAAWAAVIVFVVFPLVVGGITLLAWLQTGAP
jgi:hypothetical protein